MCLAAGGNGERSSGTTEIGSIFLKLLEGRHESYRFRIHGYVMKANRQRSSNYVTLWRAAVRHSVVGSGIRPRPK